MTTLPYNHKLDSIDINAPGYHERQANQQEWNVGRWLRGKGINLDDLDGHQQITDVITLINVRDDLWNRMNLSEQATWGAYWNIVYKHKYPLNQKFWKKFERIVQAIDSREHIMAQQRQLIKAQRQNTKNLDYDNKANGSRPAQSNLREMGQQGCHQVSQ
jgi:hypothetical protein